MRTSILLWSTASGVLLGLFLDAILIGVAVLAGQLMPGLAGRLQQRWFTMSSIAALALIPLAMAVLGFLEGQLKTR